MKVVAFVLYERQDFTEVWDWVMVFITLHREKAEAWKAAHGWREYKEIALLPSDAEELDRLERKYKEKSK